MKVRAKKGKKKGEREERSQEGKMRARVKGRDRRECFMRDVSILQYPKQSEEDGEKCVLTTLKQPYLG